MRRGASADQACARLLEAVGVDRAEPLADSRKRRRRASPSMSRLIRALRTGGLPTGARSGRRRDTRMVLAAAAAISRTESSGAKLAATLIRVSARARQESHAATIAAARRAGVMAVAPLGLCFLPAFLLLGVVPVVIGSAPDLGPAFQPQP